MAAVVSVLKPETECSERIWQGDLFEGMGVVAYLKGEAVSNLKLEE